MRPCLRAVCPISKESTSHQRRRLGNIFSLWKRTATQAKVMPHTEESAPILTPPPGVEPMEFLMEQARRKYKLKAASSAVPMPAIPTPENLDTDERTDAAIAVSEDLITEAHAHLNTFRFRPLELTPAENAEHTNANSWQHAYDTASRYSQKLAKDNDKLSEIAMRLINELQTAGLPVPADIEIPSPITPTTRELDIPLNTHLWLQRRYNFREYSNRDFEAAAAAEGRKLTTFNLETIPEQRPAVQRAKTDQETRRRKSKLGLTLAVLRNGIVLCK
ncbi:uncharacterized protein MYCFIDRAFT_171961 [Pseudocercospora fijiensis CIRAD86]|uniref:Uncharacterized protein n=1 Tax=Pseudocercospora fijiensis (strain CIRAD86) TaxID=383855 RepID=M2Z8Q6_PSEFD|nr:uncharacterized protein MYCFIDRAFT_171961 [Pseudocercospora fijiensis CIRAD86]EME86165.1 hypothetical protein MYCFIDRAFT_171961 [Pseudocercospora fijiensis CIRAD86]